MTLPRAALGVADHCGWAVFVCVTERDGAPVVVNRRRVELLDAKLPNAPYEHHAHRLTPPDAEALVGRVKQSAKTHARSALSQLCTDLDGVVRLVAVALREGPAKAIPATVAEVLESRAATYAADGELFRRALCDAATGLGLEVALQPRRPETARATPVLGRDADAFLKELGRELGPPWRKDHRTASVAAIMALDRGRA